MHNIKGKRHAGRIVIFVGKGSLCVEVTFAYVRLVSLAQLSVKNIPQHLKPMYMHQVNIVHHLAL